ncbi:MAG: MBL fold metallo-hydrolase [Ignisphaera sp.]
MTKKYMIFLGTASSIPSIERFTPSIAICGSKECILLDVGEGSQIRLSSVGVDHRRVKVIAISHVHGDHIHGLLPFLESLGLKILSQKTSEKYILKIVAPSNLCKYLYTALGIIKVGNLGENLEIQCVEAKQLHQYNTFVVSPNNEFLLTSIPVEHGFGEAYGYYVRTEVKKNTIGLFYSGDGVCREICLEKLKTIKPNIVIHEATYLDYPVDKVRALENFHSTVWEAAKLAEEIGALLLILTHISARYRYEDLRDFVSRARRIFGGDIVIAEDLAKIPLNMISV